MARSRPVTKFQTFDHSGLCDYSKTIELALTGNLTFPTPPVTLVAQGAANDAMQAAINAWGDPTNRGSHAQHVALLDAAKVVQENLRNLRDYVDGIAAGDAGLILSSGFMVSAVVVPIGPLTAPVDLHQATLKTMHSGQTRLRWGKVKGADSYNVYTAATTTDPYVLIGNTTKTLFVNTGVPGRLGYYKVVALGAAGTSPMSDICEAYSASKAS